MVNPTLALDGGPKAVTAPVGDAWPKVSPLEKEYVNRVVDNIDSAYDEIDTFEQEFRESVGTRYAVAMCNGTATIHSAVFAAGARQGREVIVPSVTWHASISPILHCGATPVFCDVDPDTYCADPGRRPVESHPGDVRHRRHPHLRQPRGHGRFPRHR